LEDKRNLSRLQEAYSKYEIETSAEINDMKIKNNETDKNIKLLMNNIKEENQQFRYKQQHWLNEKQEFEKKLKDKRIQLETIQAKLKNACVRNKI
jgi:hypothetical protein